MVAKVTFYPVQDNSAKIQFICMKAQEALKYEKRLMIVVPNFQAAKYVEELLWHTPAESFIPHIVTDMPTSEWIAITLQDKANINQASCLLNLCTSASSLYQQVEEIDEMYDMTHPQKIEFAQERFRFYEAQGISPTLLT